MFSLGFIPSQPRSDFKNYQVSKHTHTVLNFRVRICLKKYIFNTQKLTTLIEIHNGK